MRFETERDTYDMSSDEIQSLIKSFVTAVLKTNDIKNIEIFGGTVREPEKTHSDIDLLVTVEPMPNEESLDRMSPRWKQLMNEYPAIELIDLWLTDGTRVASVRHDLDFMNIFAITDTPKTGGLDDDDTHIYIGRREKIMPRK